MNYTEEQIKEKFDSLPQDVKEAISSVDTTNDVINIGDKYSLHVDQLGELVDETGLVMLGLTSPNDFVSNLKNRLDIPRQMAESLVKDINDQILIKIRASLREIHNAAEAEENVTPEEEFVPIKKEEKMESNLEREQILREIENPEESNVEIDRNENDELKDMTMVMKGQSTSLDSPAHTDLMETKLKEVVQIPRKERDISENVDPYREPID